MSKIKHVDKHRPSICSQSHISCRWYCPVCRLTKVPRQCKVYKTPAALWRHLRLDHGEFAYVQFNSDDVYETLNVFTKGLKWGMI